MSSPQEAFGLTQRTGEDSNFANWQLAILYFPIASLKRIDAALGPLVSTRWPKFARSLPEDAGQRRIWNEGQHVG